MAHSLQKGLKNFLCAVDLDLPFDSRIGLRCRGPVVRAFRPEWDRSANQSNSEPYARKTMLLRRETACTALASRARAKPAGTTTGPPSPASGAACAITRSACLRETNAARRGGKPGPLRAAAAGGNDPVSPGAGPSRNLPRRSRSRGRRELAAICQRRVRGVSRMRHPCTRLPASALHGVRPR